MPDTPGAINFPTALDSVVSLVEVANNATAALTANISVSDLLIPIDQPGKFSNSGIATLTDSLTAPTKIEIFVYTGKSGSNLVVPVGGRGAQGTTAQAFSTGQFVEQRPTARHHTVLADLLRAIEAKLGIGADTPGPAVEALFSNGAGASLWRAIQAADVPNVVRSDLATQQTIISNLQMSKDAPSLSLTDTSGPGAGAANLAVDGGFMGFNGAVAAFNFALATGIVQFAQIPLLPPADPTLNEQAVRKAYVDSRKTRFSVTAAFLLDPSVNPPFADATQLPVWVAPVGLTGGFLSRFGVIRFGGVHNPGTAISFALIQNSSTIATVQFDDTNSAGFTTYVNDFADVPVGGGNAVWVVVNGRSGTIGERSVSIWFEGYQNVA
jgi:hypothetical protein